MSWANVARKVSRVNLAWLLALLLVVPVAGCGGGGDDSGQATTSSKPAATQAPAVDPATVATVTGKVAFEGTAPKMQVIDVSSEQTCHEHSASTPLLQETVVVNSNGTLKNVFIYVKSGLGDAKFPVSSEPVILDQIGCAYQPHVFGVQAKQPILIKNSDEGVLHNIHAVSSAGNSFNFGMPKVMETTKAFKKPEVMVKIKCDVHGWMGAYAGVMPHPFFGVTGEDGMFTLESLPPGDYVIEAWHEEYGTQTQNVTVGAKETKDITFTFKSGS